MTKNNLITGMISIEPTSPEPYLLKFDYKGNEGLRERLLNVSKYLEKCIYLKDRFIFKKQWSIASRIKLERSKHFIFYELDKLITNQTGISFFDRKKAEKALVEIEVLLNEYLLDIQKDYEKLLVEKDFFISKSNHNIQ